MRWAPILLAGLLVSPVAALSSSAGAQGTHRLSENAQTEAVAVARTEGGGTVGLAATISVTVSENGTGGVFLDTRPLTGTDMQGSARIAARVAASLTGYPLDGHDFYFVVRSDSPVISGPSAGSVMALAATVALENLHRGPDEPAWEISDEVMVTGTINPDGSIGPVGGILEKARAAAREGATLFLVPEGQGTFRSTGEGAGRSVDVAEFCEREVGITCREVAHLEELVRLATGHAFVTPDAGPDPSTARYRSRLAPLADRLVERGRLYQGVWARLNHSDLAEEPAREVLEVVRGAQADVRRAEANVEADRFYSAASRAFTGAIQARHAQLLLAYHESGRDPDVVDAAIANATEAVDGAREAASAANVTGMQTLYTVGAAQKRVSDAEQRVREAESAWNGSGGPQPSRALQAAARARERSATVHWWLQLGEAFGPGPSLTVPAEELADEMMSLADELLAYTTQVLGNRQPASAARSMQQARENVARDFHAGAALEAAEAQVASALAIELRAGGVGPDKLESSRRSAVQAIQAARGLGVEPILPVALFEFGGVQEQAGAALQFYRTARVLAGLSETLEVATDPTPTEHVGGWGGPEEPVSVGHTYRSVAVGWFLLGAFATAAAALFGWALANPSGTRRRV